MSKDAKIWLLLIGFIGFVMIMATIAYVQGQQTTTTTTAPTPTTTNTNTPVPQAPPPAIDPGTLAAVAGPTGAGIIIATIKQILDQRKNTNRDKTTDKDTGRFIILISKFYQAKYLYPHMTDKEILDLPISNNPMSKMTLGQAITAEADLWATGNQQYWNIPQPQMSVPTLTTVEAIQRPNQAVPLVPSSANAAAASQNTQTAASAPASQPSKTGSTATSQPAANTGQAAAGGTK